MALEEKDKIKDLFSSKLKDFEADVPDSVWAGIDQSLSQPPMVAKPASSRYSLLRTISVAASIAGTIILATALFFISRPDGVMQRATSDAQPGMLERKNIIYEGQEDASVWDFAGESDNFAYIDASSLISSPVGKSLKEILAIENTKATTLLCEASVPTRDLAGIVPAQKRPDVKRYNNDVLIPASSDRPVIISKQKKESNGTFLSLNAGSEVLAPGANKQGSLSPFSSKTSPEVKETFSDMIIDLEHNQPISFGFMINKQLSSKLSIETGLTYTYLSSRFRSKADNDVSGKTNFHYLGVPVNLNYNVLQLGKANVYVSVGGTIEKDIQGRLKWSVKNEHVTGLESGLASNENKDAIQSDDASYLLSERTNIHQDKLQFSAQMAVGASYPLYEKLYVYGTVGGAYYFDANNEYPTIYSDKKFQLDLNLGLKWKF